MAEFFESSFGQESQRDSAVSNFYSNLFESYGESPFSNVASIFRSTETAKQFLESVNNVLEESDYTGTGLQNAILREDAQARSIAMGNVVTELVTESAQQGLAALRPISLTSFGFQIRSYTKAVMHRTVKTLQAEKPAFKITERKQFLIDINGNRRYFTEAFNHKSDLADNIAEKFDMVVDVPSRNYDIFAENSIDARNKLAVDLAIKSFTAVEADGTTAAATTAITSAKREIDIETGTFQVDVKFGTDNFVATISGQVDFNSNTVNAISATTNRIKTVTFAARLSSETHLSALVVGMEHENTTVNIPDGTHIEVELSQEFTDDASRMLGINILEEYTNQMGTTIEKLEDMHIYKKHVELESVALVKADFNCTPDAGYAYGKEAWIKQEFHPFIERVCIRLKSELQLDDCHFRVVGNPLDIRVPNAAGEEYIFRRNQEMTGAVKTNYDFAVVSSGNTIFYLSSDRVPPGKLYIHLIPNSIENNIITVNHYRYANYVSNKYRSSRNPALPTVMVSSRYKTQEYLPVMAVVNVLNNSSALFTGVYNG